MRGVGDGLQDENSLALYRKSASDMVPDLERSVELK